MPLVASRCYTAYATGRDGPFGGHLSLQPLSLARSFQSSRQITNPLVTNPLVTNPLVTNPLVTIPHSTEEEGDIVRSCMADH